MIAIVYRLKDRDAKEKLVALGYRLAYQNADHDVPLRSARAGPGDVTRQTTSLQLSGIVTIACVFRSRGRAGVCRPPLLPTLSAW